mmetsp:Transcript_26611/g.40610  ORF Transcript_26611/g.40610 Transcript_26611/m.40610 type:complete len:102 (+) Transcript_26611:3368-3673(+)
MCGRVLIQLSRNLSFVEDVGCIVLQTNNSVVNYRFCSLLKNETRKIILELIRSKKLGHIVRFNFDLQPVSPQEYASCIYILHCIDTFTKQTSVIKLNSDTL